MSRELLKRALDALGTSTWDHTRAVGKQELIDALREALAAPQPEPVAWKCAKCGNTSDCEGVTVGDNWCNSCAVCGEMKPLYATAPPAAPAPAVPEVMAGPMPPMSEADEKRLNAALTIVFDLACGPADPTMMQDELVAAAESIGMRFPAPAVPDDATILAEHLTRALKANGDLSASLSKARGMVLELDSVLRMAESHNDGKTTAASIRAACEPYLPLSAAPAVPLTDTRKLCTCDGAGRGPGRACVVQAGGRLGELWKCAKSAAPAVPLTDDMVEVEFVSRGDDKGQGLHPYWKDAFREGFNFARSRLSAAPAVREPLTQAATDVLAERKRQVEAEGWTPEHDDQHGDGSMALAAAVYALIGSSDGRHRGDNGQTPSITEIMWPWEWSWLKPKSRRSNLTRAAALLLAEIERLDRKSGIGGGGNG